MKKSKILAGIVITITACLLAAAGLAGCQRYMKRQEVTQFRKLIDSYAESNYNQAFYAGMHESYLDGSFLGGHEQQMEEYNDWYKRFQQQSHNIPLKEWIRAFEDDRIQDKTIFIVTIDSANQQYWKEVEQFFPVLNSNALSMQDRQYLCAHLKPSKEQRQQLEQMQWEWLEETQVDNAMEFYRYIQEVNEEGEQMKECADHFLSNPGQHSKEKLVGAACIKLNYQTAEEIEAYNDNEKEQLAALLRTECRKLSIGELFNTDAVNMLEALLALENLEDIDWVLEELDQLEMDGSLLAWNQIGTIKNYLADNMIYKLCSSLSVQSDVLSRVVKVMNKINNLSMAVKSRETVKKVELYLNTYSDAYSNQADAAHTLSMLTREQTPQDFTGWQAVCDVDGDGLGDQESFEAMNASGQAVYDVTFANGDRLHYAFPVRIPGVYERRNADLNGDGINEVIVYFYIDVQTMEERYGITLNDIPDGCVESYSTLAAKEPAGIVVFTKQADETVYRPVLTNAGTTMVTDIFKEQNEYGTERILDEEKDWTTQLVWESDNGCSL